MGVTRRNQLYKWFVYTLALLPVWWLDAFVLSRFPIFGVTPILLPVAAVCAGVLLGVAGGAGFGLYAGLIWAAAYAGGQGGRVLMLTLAGMIAGALAQHALAQSLPGCLLCCAGALGLLELFHLVKELFFLRADLWSALCSAVPQFLWTLCWVPLIYRLFARVFARLDRDRT